MYGNGAGTGMKKMEKVFQNLPAKLVLLLAFSESYAAALGDTTTLGTILLLTVKFLPGATYFRAILTGATVSVLCVPALTR